MAWRMVRASCAILVTALRASSTSEKPTASGHHDSPCRSRGGKSTGSRAGTRGSRATCSCANRNPGAVADQSVRSSVQRRTRQRCAQALC